MFLYPLRVYEDCIATTTQQHTLIPIIHPQPQPHLQHRPLDIPLIVYLIPGVIPVTSRYPPSCLIPAFFLCSTFFRLALYLLPLAPSPPTSLLHSRLLFPNPNGNTTSASLVIRFIQQPTTHDTFTLCYMRLSYIC